MPRGGKRAGAGAKRGSQHPKSPEKEALRLRLRTIVSEHWDEMVRAQKDSAVGINHFMLRDPETGQFKRLTDPDQITKALNAPNAAEGSTYYIYAKDPSIQAFTDLANRTIDKPAETMAVTHAVDADFLARLSAARKRVS